MAIPFVKHFAVTICVSASLFLLCAGCCGTGGRDEFPRELSKVDLPEYTIAPPDVLVINALRVVPRPPYHIQPLDYLNIQASPTPAEQPILGLFAVSPEGNVNLGYGYGVVEVMDLTLKEAKAAIQKHLKAYLKDVEVSITLAQSESLQQIRGDHLVRPDGTIGLGTYGSLRVSGMTIEQARGAMEAHLAQFLLNPKIAVDISGFNSKAYYVITDGGGFGEQVIRLPSMGSETVLDAISQVYGLSPVSCRYRIWISRPTPEDPLRSEILPVNWVAITQAGSAATNYQVFPNDRIYIKANPLITLDTQLARFIGPIERVLGVTLLGSTTVNSIRTNGQIGANGTP